LIATSQNAQSPPSDGTGMPPGRLWRAYLAEARCECFRALRAPAFAIPFLALPIALYLFIGIYLVGSMSHGDPKTAITMFVNFGVFGVMGPGMFGFGIFVATEREQGLLRLKRALPMPAGSYLLAKMMMAVVFAGIIMVMLIAAAVALGGLRLSVAQFVTIFVIDILGALPFCAVGLFIGTRTSAKAAPAFVNLAYLPMMYLGGLFFPLPRSIQFIERASPAFHLDQLGLLASGTPSLDQLALGVAGASSQGTPFTHVAVLAGVTLVFTLLAIRRLSRVG